ncbi:unnamed protein product [Schistosoma turkestanicum]|nr:unnamed protein product [Schistosoma turkestanicum]CAH8436516.1 unnamed protein product [Schistosoma turkestanicum]
MKLTMIMLAVFCIVGAMTVIKATTIEQPPYPGEKDMKLQLIDIEYEKKGGLKSICNEFIQSYMKGRRHIYAVIDKYIRKDDLGTKMHEVAVILGGRIEKRMKYFAMHLDKMLNFESS